MHETIHEGEGLTLGGAGRAGEKPQREMSARWSRSSTGLRVRWFATGSEARPQKRRSGGAGSC